MCGWYGGGAFWMPFMALFGFLLFFAAILLAFWVARRLFLNDNRPAETPLDILKRRYASGEINHEEYERMKNELS